MCHFTIPEIDDTVGKNSDQSDHVLSFLREARLRANSSKLKVIVRGENDVDLIHPLWMRLDGERMSSCPFGMDDSFESGSLSADFSDIESDIEEREFIAQDLVSANFVEGNLEGADFRGARLSRADFSRSRLRMANFRFSNLKGAKFKHADLTYGDLSMATLIGADFGFAELCKVNFQAARLNGANLENADLSFATLIEADLRGANLRGADWRSANFKGAMIDEHTVLPFSRTKAEEMGMAYLPSGMEA